MPKKTTKKTTTGSKRTAGKKGGDPNVNSTVKPAVDPILEVRKRFLTDFPFWAKHACKIRTKAGEIKPLVLNVPQTKLQKVVTDQIKAKRPIRIVILKGRQQGFSTWVSGFNYWHLSQHPASKGLVVAHVAESTNALWEMYKRIHENTPDMLRPSTRYSSRTELVFDKLDTGLRIATAAGKAIGRGEMFSHMHLSEVAFWNPTFASENLNGILQCVPNTPNTAVFIESTANGMTGEFYSMWQGAVAGTNGFIPFFSPWFDTPEYREPAPEGFERTFEEEDLAATFGLDDEQLQWRRTKIAQNGIDLFRQEYPCTPEEAFIASGRPVFNPDQIHAMLKTAKDPIERRAVEAGAVREHPYGELFVYHKQDPSEEYYIGADVGIGIRDGDYSVAQVFDSKKRQVAVWRGQVQPDYFASILEALGYYYNTARVAPERNAHGLLTAVRLGRDLLYPNVWTDIAEGQLIDKESINIGFLTTARTKPLVIDKLRGALREGEIELNDKTTLREMLSFIVTESGNMEAEQGAHDDCVMALAICNHIHEGKWTPIEVTDEFYVEAI